MSMSISHTSHNPRTPRQHRSHSRSQTEPVTDKSGKPNPARSAVGAPSPSSRRFIHARDASAGSVNTSTPNTKKRRSTTLTAITIPTPKNNSRQQSPSRLPRPETRDSTADALTSAEPRPNTPPNPLLRVPSNASTTDSRSPSQRKPPASHSSYGVETSNGPPPSFSTQRTLSQDRPWKPSTHSSEPGNSADDMAALPDSQSKPNNPETPKTLRRPSESADGRSGKSTETLCTAPESQSHAGSKSSSSDDLKGDDLFLNLAHADGVGQDTLSRSEKRNSKVGSLYASLMGRSNSERTADSALDQDSATKSTAGLDSLYQPNKRHSLGPRSSAATAHPLDASSRQKYFNGNKIQTGLAHSIVGGDRETSPESPRQGLKPFYLETNARSYRRSNLASYRTDRSSPPQEYSDRASHVERQPTRVEGTESTISTTAPSTMWDELDDLKSRLRKLELSGKLPASSAAAMASAERPHTATTTVTTMSSSPKQPKALTVQEPAFEGVPKNVHPLLQEALRKARPSLSADVYQKLEATATDVLHLATMVGSGNPAGTSTIGIQPSSERHLRRRADNACRGLTELAIALSARPRSSGQMPTLRPSSRDAMTTFAQTPPPTSYSADSVPRPSRRLSNDRDDARSTVSSRLQGRYEGRRGSLLTNSLSFSNNLASPSHEPAPSPVIQTASLHPQLRLQTESTRSPRIFSSRRSHHPAEPIDAGTDSDNDNNNSPSIRPISRAMTETGLRHRSARDRSSLGREYTSTHPLPSFVRKAETPTSARPPSVLGTSGLTTSRRTYASSRASDIGGISVSPATPKDNSLLPTYRRYASTSLNRDRDRDRDRESPTVAYLNAPADPADILATPDNNITLARGASSGSRRSLGLTSRLGQVGNFMGGRLRSVRVGEKDRERDREREKELPPTPEYEQSRY